jgi:hypothetical protein
MKIYRIGKSASINRTLTEAVGFLITPDDVDREKAITGWSYAVRYTAKGLDVPDYEAAARMVVQRHPTWQCFAGPEVDGIWYSASHAENDIPE